MGKARHIDIRAFFHNIQQSFLEIKKEPVRLQHLFSGIKTHVKGYLVVSAAAGVQLLSRISDALYQICLHKAVNILILLCNRKPARLHILQNAPRPAMI